MQSSILVASAAVVVSFASAASAGVTGPRYGTLNDGTNDVAFNVGNSIGSNDFWFSNTDVGGKALTLGMKSIGYFGQNPNPVYTENGTWEAQAGFNAGPSGSPSAPTWNFIWSVTMDGAQPTEADGLYWSMRITGPNGGTWGTTVSGMAALSGGFNGNSANPVYQNAWVGSFDFLQLSSLQSGGPEGIWSGLAFNPTVNGSYTFDLAVFGSPTSTTALSTLTMTVNVVPSPGAIALLGVAGLASRRRRA
jgi:hypothetical protein